MNFFSLAGRLKCGRVCRLQNLTQPSTDAWKGFGTISFTIGSVVWRRADDFIASSLHGLDWEERKKVVEKVAPNGTESPNPCDIRFHCAGFGKLPKGIEMIQTSTVPPHQRLHPFPPPKSKKGFLLLLSHAQHAAGGELSFCDVPPTLISLTNKINKNVSPRNST